MENGKHVEKMMIKKKSKKMKLKKEKESVFEASPRK